MFIDAHAHLDQEEFNADVGEVIARARAAGVETMICPAATRASSEAVVRLANVFGVHAAVGIHPNYTHEAAPDDFECISALVGRPGVVAIGETGLDRHWDYAPIALQQDYFDRHLRLSQQCGLPVIIHCREAEADLLPMLRAAAERASSKSIHGVLHAFSGDTAFAAECLSLGLFVSFAGNVTYSNKKFEAMASAARTIPSDRLLIETDSPYLTPAPFRGKIRRNEPMNVIHTASFLAKLRGVSVEQLAAETTANARRLFALPI